METKPPQRNLPQRNLPQRNKRTQQEGTHRSIKMKDFIIKYKGVITILITLLTLCGTILYKVAKMESMAEENTEYRKESEKSRKFFELEFVKMMGMMEQMISLVKENKEDIRKLKDEFIEYKEENQNNIYKFYQLNRDLKDPRLHTDLDTIPIIFPKDIVIYENRNETIREYVKL